MTSSWIKDDNLIFRKEKENQPESQAENLSNEWIESNVTSEAQLFSLKSFEDFYLSFGERLKIG